MKEFTKAYVGLGVLSFVVYLFALIIGSFIENKVEYWWVMLTTGFIGFLAFYTAIFVAEYAEEMKIEKRKEERQKEQRILASSVKLRRGMTENVPNSNSIFTEPFNFLKEI